MNFLKKFAFLLEDTEVPPRFAIWCGLATLLGALERRIWLDQGIYQIYPNFFFVLVAASGQKKSTAIGLTERLLRRTDPGPKIISQMITPEGLIAAIKSEEIQDKSKLLQHIGGGIVIADELVTLIDRKAIERGLGKVLTTLYDCKEVFEYRTVARGIERIHNAYLSLIGGTTVELLRDAIPLSAIGGGLTSRIVFVYDDSVPPPVPWVQVTEEQVKIEEELIRYLQKLAGLEGAVMMTKEARASYDHDYREFYKSKFKEHVHLRGYANRRHAHLLKIAMAVMVAEDPENLTLDVYHLQGAKILLEEAEIHMERVVDLITSTETGSMSLEVHAFIAQNGPVPRSTLLRRFSHRLDAKELSKIMETLILSNKVRTDAQRGSLLYEVVKDG